MRIGLTQRVVTDPRHGERRDALDQRWMVFLRALDATPVILPNATDPPEEHLTVLNLDGAILTGGNNVAAPAGTPDAAPERDRLEQALIDHCANRGLPLVGICRGLQMMQHLAGGPLCEVTEHAGTRHGLHWGDDVPEAMRSGEVNSYHDFGISEDDLGSGYRPLALAEDGTVEAIAHREHAWLGIMWHPEREPEPRDADLLLLRRTLAGERA